jgi:hypothetical protein
MGFDVQNPLSPILTGGISYLTGQAQHDEQQRQLELARQQAHDQLDNEFALRKQALDQQKQATQNQADEARQRAQLEADQQSLTSIDQQNQIRASQSAHSNSLYAGLAGKLIGADTQHRAQAEQDQRQQALFQQQQALLDDRDQQAQILQGLKTGTLRWSPQQKQEQAQLQDAMHRADGDPTLSPEQRAQAHAQFTQRLNTMRPMQVPADEVPPSPEEVLKSKQLTGGTSPGGTPLMYVLDRSGRPVLDDQSKEALQSEYRQKEADLKASHAIAQENAKAAAKEQERQAAASEKQAETARRHAIDVWRAKKPSPNDYKNDLGTTDTEAYERAREQWEFKEPGIDGKPIQQPPRTDVAPPPGPGMADATQGALYSGSPQQATPQPPPAPPRWDNMDAAAAALSGEKYTEPPPQQSVDVTAGNWLVDHLGGGANPPPAAPQAQQQSAQTPPPVATYSTRDQVVADIKSHRLKVGDWVQTPRGTRQLTPDDIQAAGS